MQYLVYGTMQNTHYHRKPLPAPVAFVMDYREEAVTKIAVTFYELFKETLKACENCLMQSSSLPAPSRSSKVLALKGWPGCRALGVLPPQVVNKIFMPSVHIKDMGFVAWQKPERK